MRSRPAFPSQPEASKGTGERAWAEASEEGLQDDEKQLSLRDGSTPEPQTQGPPGEKFVTLTVKGGGPPSKARSRAEGHAPRERLQQEEETPALGTVTLGVGFK